MVALFQECGIVLHFLLLCSLEISFSIKGRHCKECVPERANYNPRDCTLSIEKGTLKALIPFLLEYQIFRHYNAFCIVNVF